MGKYIFKEVSNEDLIADARGYRQGRKYWGGEKVRKQIDSEIQRRKKLGLMRKNVKGTKKKVVASRSGFGFPRGGFGFKAPSFRPPKVGGFRFR
jgi:hypothetical protein